MIPSSYQYTRVQIIERSVWLLMVLGVVGWLASVLIPACSDNIEYVEQSKTTCMQAIDRKVTTISLHECIDTLGMLRNTAPNVTPCMLENRPMYCASMSDGSVQTYNPSGTVARRVSMDDGMQIPLVY